MYVFGGFNSLLLSDILVYTSPSCSAFSSPATCAQAWPGVLCVWNSTLEVCLPWDSSSSSSVGADQHQPPALCNTRSCRCQRDGGPAYSESDNVRCAAAKIAFRERIVCLSVHEESVQSL